MTTKVGKFTVPVLGQDQVGLYHFTGGKHEGDEGLYGFWTVMLKRRLGGEGSFIVRSKVGADVGERVSRFPRDAKIKTGKHRQDCLHKWHVVMERGANVDFIRAANQRECDLWLDYYRDTPQYEGMTVIRPPQMAYAVLEPEPA